MDAGDLYDRIGTGYAVGRRTDPRIAARIWAALGDAETVLNVDARTEPVEIPWDCVDGFFHAHWRRPEAYLREDVRRATSVWAGVGPVVERRVVAALRGDVDSGAWHARNGELLEVDAADLGARLLVAG